MSLANIKNLFSSLNYLEKTGIIILFGLLVFLLVLSFRCHVYGYDSFEHLNNARHLIGIHTRYDFVTRPPFFAAFLLPFAWLAKVLDVRAIIERLPYFLMTIAGFSAVLILWQIMRNQLVDGFAMIAVLGLALNSLFLHFWIFLMPEVFACFLLAVFWHSVIKERFWLVAIALGLVLNLRYQLFPLSVLGVFYSIITEENILKDKKWLQVLKNWTLVAVVSFTILVGLHYLAIVCGAKLSFLVGIQQIVTGINSQYGVTDPTKHDSIFALLDKEFSYLIYFVTGPILLLALVGVLKSLYRREKLDYLFLIWFWGIFLSIALVIQIRWKEPRYLIVVLPPIYYFFALGLSLIWQYLSQLLSSANNTLRSVLLTIFSLALAIAPISNAQTELFRLCDESYTRNVGTQLATLIKPNISATEPVFWAGEYYTIAPNNYMFSPIEKYFFFNLFSNGLSFYMDRLCHFNYSEHFIYQGAVGSYIVVNRNSCQDCRQLAELRAMVPLTIHKVTQQAKFHRTNKTIEKLIDNTAITFLVFTSETGEELYLSEVQGKLIFQKANPQPSVLVQFIYQGERLPIYAEASHFGLPNQANLTQRLQIANIDFVLVSELSPSLGEVH